MNKYISRNIMSREEGPLLPPSVLLFPLFSTTIITTHHKGDWGFPAHCFDFSPYFLGHPADIFAQSDPRDINVGNYALVEQ